MALTMQRVFCAVEMSLDDISVLACACLMARPFQARVFPFLIREDYTPPTRTSLKAELSGLDTERDAELLFAELLGATPGSRLPAADHDGPRGVVERSKQWRADLIVLGSRAVSTPPQRPTALVDELVRSAGCPVLCVPALKQPASVSRILLPVDFSEGTGRAVSWAGALARRFGATVHVVHAVGSSALRATRVRGGITTPSGFSNVLARLSEIELHLQATGVSCESSIAEQGTTHAILAAQEREGCDLIVMGVHAHRDELAAATGIAAAIRRRVPVPVFSLPPPSSSWFVGLASSSQAVAEVGSHRPMLASSRAWCEQLITGTRAR